MRTPIIALRNQRADRGQHAGLLLQRYLCENATGKGGNPEEKRSILRAAINAAGNEAVQSLYRGAFDRWKAALPKDPSPIELTTQGRLIVGLGSENVLETGIRLHHTYGLPIIPGSALKGLAAHYCDHVWGSTDEKFKKPTPPEDEAYRTFLAGNGPRPKDNFHRLLFGNTDDNGCIVFHDAWFVPGSEKESLKLDVMTPHHSGWNKCDKPEPPTDFDNPVPVPFLSVTGKFLIAVSWHGPVSDLAEKWTDLARSLLCDALRDWGVGGKTTSGYGRLVSPDDVIASGSPGGERLVAAANSAAGATAFWHDKGDEVQVVKFVDDKGKQKFRTPDGLIAHAGPEDVSDIPENEPIKLWIKNRNDSPRGYTLTRIQPSADPNRGSRSKGRPKGKR